MWMLSWGSRGRRFSRPAAGVPEGSNAFPATAQGAWFGWLSGERGQQLPGGAGDGEVALAGVELQLRAVYRLGEEPGVLGRDGGVRLAVVDRCRRLDGTELETPGPGEHPQVLGHPPTAAAERFGVAGQEGLAHAGLL